MNIRISLAQMDIKFGDPAANLVRVEEMAAEAARRDSQLLLLPELWSTAYDLTRAEQHATHLDDGVLAAVAQLARRYKLHIVGSTLTFLGPDVAGIAGRPAVGNSLTWFTPEGANLATYSKLHLFRLMAEEQYLTAGATPMLATAPWGRVGLAICYDLRFPELFRHYALAGAGLLLLPAEWPHPRLAHWQSLLRARAIENQMFVAACNRVGQVGETNFCGHSVILDPWGEKLVEGDERESLLTAELDMTQVAAVRQKIPVFEDRRPDCYG